MQVKDRQINTNQETVKRNQTETWTTEDGKKRIVTVHAETTGAENRRTQTTEWKVRITNKNNPNNTFRYTTTHNSGCQGDLDYMPVINEARQAWSKHQEEKKATPANKVEADDATRDTKLRDLIDKDDYQYNEIPEDMTVGELRDKMKAGEAYYDICPVDSVIRETHFLAIANAHNIDYDEPYENRLNH